MVLSSPSPNVRMSRLRKLVRVLMSPAMCFPGRKNRTGRTGIVRCSISGEGRPKHRPFGWVAPEVLHEEGGDLVYRIAFLVGAESIRACLNRLWVNWIFRSHILGQREAKRESAFSAIRFSDLLEQISRLEPEEASLLLADSPEDPALLSITLSLEECLPLSVVPP